MKMLNQLCTILFRVLGFIGRRPLPLLILPSVWFFSFYLPFWKSSDVLCQLEHPAPRIMFCLFPDSLCPWPFTVLGYRHPSIAVVLSSMSLGIEQATVSAMCHRFGLVQRPMEGRLFASKSGVFLDPLSIEEKERVAQRADEQTKDRQVRLAIDSFGDLSLLGDWCLLLAGIGKWRTVKGELTFELIIVAVSMFGMACIYNVSQPRYVLPFWVGIVASVCILLAGSSLTALGAR